MSGVFLHALRCAFDGAEPRPVGHVVIIHRGAPAENIVADEKPREYAHKNRDHGNAGKGGKLTIELRECYLPWSCERLLNHIIERAIPGIDGNTHLDLKYVVKMISAEPRIDQRDHLCGAYHSQKPAKSATATVK